MYSYKNGNANISIDNEGTRIITYSDELKLEYPLNIDIRVSTKCAFGFNPKTNSAFCDFCHESARTDGNECDYDELKYKLSDLPEGIELAIGTNQLTEGLYEFILWCSLNHYIVNLTVNQGHINRDYCGLYHLLECGFIKGLGISYRSGLQFNVPQQLLDHPNVVFHVISGIDNIDDVILLRSKGVKKILVLGEKDFGFNIDKVNLDTRKHKEWFWWVHKLFSIFDVVSFDNLGLEQLNIKRFFNNENWELFNQGEHSLFLDSVNGFYHISSRSNKKVNWNDMSIKEFFLTYIRKN